MITIFKKRCRKQICLNSVPERFKKRRVEHAFMTLSKRKQQRALDKEVPCHKIPENQKDAYKAAELKEWQSWIDYDAVEVLDETESQKVLAAKPERVLKSRYVFRNKNAG